MQEIVDWKPTRRPNIFQVYILFFDFPSVFLRCLIMYVYILYEPRSNSASCNLHDVCEVLTRNVQHQTEPEDRCYDWIEFASRLNRPVQQPPFCTNTDWIEWIKHRIPVIMLLPSPAWSCRSTYLTQISHPGALFQRLAARYRYLNVSATLHASKSAKYALELAVLMGKLYHTIHTCITRVTTWRAVVLTGDLIKPGRYEHCGGW